ncbi:MAG: hypothetical protein ACRDWA_05900 [Acidimicrobiia bacterium]
MTVDQVLKRGARLWRKVAGKQSGLERAIKRRQKEAMQVDRGPNWVQYSSQFFSVVKSKSDPEPRRGIFMYGGCDLPTLFLTVPMWREGIRGTVAISKPDRQLGSAHSRQLLQSLEGIPDDVIEETCRRLRIPRSFFRPVLFEPTFSIRGHDELGTFPKSVIVISVGSDLVRVLHRHREHGFLVDIGGWWRNQSLEKAMTDLDAARWFAERFETVGKIEPEEYQDNLRKIIRILNERLNAQVIVFNTLEVDPSNPTHNYQLVGPGHAARRRRFNLALAQLSAEMGFAIMDVDRVLKQQGVSELVDFAHFPVQHKLPVAQEGYPILRSLGVV